MAGFVDECALNVRGGDGGAGCVSFRREAHVPRAGPTAVTAATGGDVWLVADRNVASLLAFRDHPHRRADERHPRHRARSKHGTAGDDLRRPVPEGTVGARPRRRALLADLVHQGDRWLAAAGGRGGRGNARFLSNRRRAPTFAEQGEEGEERWLRLELKLMADVALVGFPNVGQVHAHLPHLGGQAQDRRLPVHHPRAQPRRRAHRRRDEFVVADIPGLIEGASEGRGLGHQFLRHVERARVLVAAARPGRRSDGTPPDRAGARPARRARALPARAARPAPGRRRHRGPTSADAGPQSTGRARSSAVTGAGVRALRRARWPSSWPRPARPSPSPRRSSSTAPWPRASGSSGTTTAAYRVRRARQAERAVALSDLTNPEALAYAHERLQAARRRQGAGPGRRPRRRRRAHRRASTFEYEPTTSDARR